VSVSWPRPFRFGVNGTTTSLQVWQEVARTAEGLGFATLIAQDHVGQQLAPLPALVAAGAVTTRLRLATVVLDNDFRHPGLLAKEAATVDVLTSGRFELGLGAGWLQSDYDKTGIPFDPPGVRIARLAEAVQICKSFFAEPEAVTFDGRHYRIQGLDAAPRPVQQPRPPLMLGGRARRMLELAAREADIVGLSLLDRRGPDLPAPPSFEQKVAWVRQAAGPRLAELELHVNASLVSVDDGQAGEAAVEQQARRTGQTVAQVLASPGTLVGSVGTVVERLFALREQFGLSYWVIPARAMPAFAPVIARL
jgi:probable F420-dependent oxidoreductase